MDFASKFEKYDSSLKALTETAVIRDLYTHLEIIVPDDEWEFGGQHNLVLSNISMQFPRPILFTNPDGTGRMWWTNGAVHNPNGPSLFINKPGLMSEKYTDENGMEHRLGGPSVVRSTDNGYNEEWRVSPGKLHRVGGPAVTTLSYAIPHVKTWEECLQLEGRRFGWKPGRFEGSQPVQHLEEMEQTWFQHGRTKREGNLPNKIYEKGVFIITIITPTLVPFTYRFAKMREYLWYSEKGILDRVDGPASVILHNVVTEDFGNERVSLNYTRFDTRWYYKGAHLNDIALDEWMDKHQIKLIDKPPIDRSAFVKEDDEFCFLTDYIPTVKGALDSAF